MTTPTGALCLGPAAALMLSIACCGPSARALERGAAEGEGGRPLIACVDARATYALTDAEHAARHTARWRAIVERRGRCFTIQPGARWERIASIGGLMLMRRTPPEPGLPPLYFRSDRAPIVSGGTEEHGADDPGPNGQAAVPLTRPAPHPVPRLSLRLTRTALQTPDRAEAEVRTEDLPPPPGPIASPAPPALPPVPASLVPVTATIPAASAGAPTAAIPLDQALPATPSALPQPDDSPASARSYAIGFALVIVLIALLLAMMALLLRFLLHWSPQPVRPVSPIREPMLPPTPAATSRNAGRPERRSNLSRNSANPGVGPNPRAGPNDRRSIMHRPAPVPIVPAMLQAATLPPGPQVWLAEDETDIQRLCILLLREAGWDARSRSRSDKRHADIVARRNGRVMALCCLQGTDPVDEQSVEEVCMTREREKADVAVIVSNAPYTLGARRLAVQTGIDLLHESELSAFAR